MPLESIYPIFAAVTAKIGCGHSVAMMPAGYWESLEGKMFPIQLKFIGKMVYVQGSFSEQDSIPKESTVHPVPVQNLPKEMEDHPGLGLETIEELDVAILTISHFAFYDNRDFFYRYIDDAFNRIDLLDLSADDRFVRRS